MCQSPIAPGPLTKYLRMRCIVRPPLLPSIDRSRFDDQIEYVNGPHRSSLRLCPVKAFYTQYVAFTLRMPETFDVFVKRPPFSWFSSGKPFFIEVQLADLQTSSADSRCAIARDVFGRNLKEYDSRGSELRLPRKRAGKHKRFVRCRHQSQLRTCTIDHFDLQRFGEQGRQRCIGLHQFGFARHPRRDYLVHLYLRGRSNTVTAAHLIAPTLDIYSIAAKAEHNWADVLRRECSDALILEINRGLKTPIV